MTVWNINILLFRIQEIRWFSDFKPKYVIFPVQIQEILNLKVRCKMLIEPKIKINQRD